MYGGNADRVPTLGTEGAAMTAPPYILKIRRNRPEARIARMAAYLIVFGSILTIIIHVVGK